MLEKAARARGGSGSNVTFLQGDLQSRIPLESGSVDLVISNCTINHAADKQAVWNEIFRIWARREVRGERHLFDERSPGKVRERPRGHRGMLGGGRDAGRSISASSSRGRFDTVAVREESAPYAKGEIEVVSLTISGTKPRGRCCCRGQ